MKFLTKSLVNRRMHGCRKLCQVCVLGGGGGGGGGGGEEKQFDPRVSEFLRQPMPPRPPQWIYPGINKGSYFSAEFLD